MRMIYHKKQKKKEFKDRIKWQALFFRLLYILLNAMNTCCKNPRRMRWWFFLRYLSHKYRQQYAGVGGGGST